MVDKGFSSVRWKLPVIVSGNRSPRDRDDPRLRPYGFRRAT